MLQDPCMTDSRACRLLTILLLYVAQGIPIGLLEFAIPAWMAANGATGAEIGYVIGMAGIPWSLKFVNGALMDRYAFLPMGRRRAWLIGAQLTMVGALLACALIEPGPRDHVLLGLIAAIVSTAVVFQDVAADALAVDIAEHSERGFTGGLMSGGQALGIAISAALTGTIIYFYGVGTAYVACAAMMALVTAYLIWMRERTGERRLPWTPGEAHPLSIANQPGGWWPMIREAFAHMFRKDSVLWLVPLFLKGMAYGTMTVATPLIAANYVGWNEAELGAANGVAQLLAAVSAIVLGGYLTMTMGAKRFQIVTIGLFSVALFAFLLLESYWTRNAVIMALVVGWTVIYYVASAPQAAITMMFCDPRTGATQFSIYMAVTNQGISFAGFSYAFWEGLGGTTGPLIALLVAFLIAMGFVATLNLPRNARETAEPLAAVA